MELCKPDFLVNNLSKCVEFAISCNFPQILIAHFSISVRLVDDIVEVVIHSV
jgi:hypothetical protein